MAPHLLNLSFTHFWFSRYHATVLCIPSSILTLGCQPSNSFAFDMSAQATLRGGTTKQSRGTSAGCRGWNNSIWAFSTQRNPAQFIPKSPGTPLFLATESHRFSQKKNFSYLFSVKIFVYLKPNSFWSFCFFFPGIDCYGKIIIYENLPQFLSNSLSLFALKCQEKNVVWVHPKIESVAWIKSGSTSRLAGSRRAGEACRYDNILRKLPAILRHP